MLMLRFKSIVIPMGLRRILDLVIFLSKSEGKIPDGFFSFYCTRKCN